ncbi:MAG: DUF1553 domain-containing protein [Acidobacteria bacterium]|nr:DUF1553 domain-containing protein [Acidobacteriota bacterium]
MRLTTLLLLAICSWSQTRFESLRIEPGEIVFAGPGASQRFIVTGTTPGGSDEQLDLAPTPVDPSVVAVSGQDVKALRPGSTLLRARAGGASASIRVEVRNAPSAVAINFDPDIISILTTKGCNSSNCHGAIAGKNGFKLSLFGYDPQADHEMIVRQHGGRRISPDQPEQSLLLRKPSFAVPHGGGKVLPPDTHDYETLLAWLRQGAPAASTGPRVARIELHPAELTLTASPAPRRIAVIARLTDGSTRDMTSRVRYESPVESIASVDGSGLLTAAKPGLTTILARAMGKAATAQVAVLAAPAAAGYTQPPSANFIDDFVFAKLRRMNLQPAALSTDEQFLRRAAVDIVGRIPTPEERRAFLAHRDRARLIDEYLGHPDHIAYRTLRLEEWFRNTQLFSQGRPMGTFKYWLRDQVETRRPYDETVRDLITALGDTARNPPANFWFPATDFMLNKFDVRQMTPSITRLFLGIRMECAECHNHPLENFTQDDFYGLAAFLGKMRVKIGHGVYRRTWYIDEKAELEHPATHKPVAPRFPGGEQPAIARPAERQNVLARWITEPGNPYFARHTVNRIWRTYFGTGIVEPFDDMRSTNRPTNPALLDRLAAFLVENRFDLRALDRLILNSRTYQLAATPMAAQPEDLERLLFARWFPRRLPAEVLLDSIAQLTGVPTPFPDHAPGTTAKEFEIGDQPSYFLATFGFPRRTTLGERDESATLAQSLHLMNRATLRDKLENTAGVLSRRLDAGEPDEAIIASLYEHAYSRMPTAEETRLVTAHLADEKTAGRTRRRALENLLLVMINSKEFQLNH